MRKFFPFFIIISLFVVLSSSMVFGAPIYESMPNCYDLENLTDSGQQGNDLVVTDSTPTSNSTDCVLGNCYYYDGGDSHVTTSNLDSTTLGGDSCGLKQIRGGYEITCKEPVQGMCNPVCQQTSVDETIYDEYCMIYTVSSSGLSRNLVGEYDYVLDNSVAPSKLTEAKR